MTALDIDAVEHNFRTNPEVVAVCQLAKEQRSVIAAQAQVIEDLRVMESRNRKAGLGNIQES